MTQQFFTKLKDIRNWLDREGVKNYSITKDLKVNVSGHLELVGVWGHIGDKPKIEYLPVRFYDVTGDCHFNNLGLKSLEGAPQMVGGEFDCTNNQLTSLKGGPIEVVGDFYCGDNFLTDLKYSPKIVSSSYCCPRNKLKTLEGIGSVGRSLYCQDNQLTNLKWVPTSIEHELVCSRNQLVSLEGLDPDMEISIICTDNPELKSLDGLVRFNSGAPEDTFVFGNTNIVELESFYNKESNNTENKGKVSISFEELEIYRTAWVERQALQNSIQATTLNDSDESIKTTLKNKQKI